MKTLLLQLDSDPHPSVFDTVTAYDAGVDHVLQYGGVNQEKVRALVHGVMFTRGGEALKNSAVFVGGSDVAAGEAMLRSVTEAFFGSARVSVMMDANGCNTTAAAAVAKMLSVTDLIGKKAVVLAGTGPVGQRAAAMLARSGVSVTLTSRSLERAQAACEAISARFGLAVSGAATVGEDQTRAALEGSVAVLCCGAAGVTLLPQAIWEGHETLAVLADVNAVPPPGIEGIKPHWNGKEKAGKIIFGATGIGGLKMKVHRACVARLFEQNDLLLDAEEILAVARERLAA